MKERIITGHILMNNPRLVSKPVLPFSTRNLQNLKKLSTERLIFSHKSKKKLSVSKSFRFGFDCGHSRA